MGGGESFCCRLSKPGERMTLDVDDSASVQVIVPDSVSNQGREIAIVQ